MKFALTCLLFLYPAYAEDYFSQMRSGDRPRPQAPRSIQDDGQDFFQSLSTSSREGGFVVDETLVTPDTEPAPSFASVWDLEQVNFGIRKAMFLNAQGKELEGLDLLRELVIKTKFTNLKAQYFLAKQYALVFEKGLVEKSMRADYLSNFESHVRKVEETIEKEVLTEEQKEYYAEGLPNLKERLAISKKEDPDAPKPALVVAPIETPAPSASSPSEPVPVLVPDQPEPVPAPYTPTPGARADNPVMSLNIQSPDQIDEATAKTILKGTGLMNSSRSYEEALKGLKQGYTYTRGSASLDSKMKEWLFREYRLLRKALEKYPDKPNISAKATPELYEKWLKQASVHLTCIPSQKDRYALMKSLMTQETGKSHWKNFVPVMGGATDIGFGQFLPATAKSVGINPYDPEENIKGIALYLNTLISQKGMKEGLASYNGGNNPPAASYRYASNIMGRMENIG